VLGDSSKKNTHHVNSKLEKVAYAEALLKPPVLTSVHNVERRMKELCLSEQGPSQ
jgi:hypothetical protein